MARRVSTAACLAAAALLAACGSKTVDVPKSDPTHAGAVLFQERCGGCHTLSVAGTHGSAMKVKDKETVDGPNFDKRKERTEDVLFAIANGGFSGAIMPENIATGPEARAIAEFLNKYSGSKAAGAESGQKAPGGGESGGGASGGTTTSGGESGGETTSGGESGGETTTTGE